MNEHTPKTSGQVSSSVFLTMNSELNQFNSSMLGNRFGDRNDVFGVKVWTTGSTNVEE